MKKILALIMLLTMAISVVGCGNSKSDNTVSKVKVENTDSADEYEDEKEPLELKEDVDYVLVALKSKYIVVESQEDFADLKVAYIGGTDGEAYAKYYEFKEIGMYMKSVKIIAEPFYKYIDFIPEQNIVKPAVIASSACDRNFYVRLPDNTLVVIDGGWRIEDWSRFEYDDLFQKMYEEMSEILGGAEIIKIPLWI